MSSEVTSAYYRNQFSLTKAGGKPSPMSTVTICCLFILVEIGSCKVLSPPHVAREPHGFTFASFDFPILLPTFFFKGVHCACFQFLFAFRWIKTYRNLMNLRVVHDLLCIVLLLIHVLQK